MFKTILLLFVAGVAPSSAQEYPKNNTGTALAAPVPMVEKAFVWEHRYGQEVVVEIEVPNLGLEKEVYVTNSDGATTKAGWCKSEGEFSAGGNRVLWLGDSDGGAKVRLAVKIAGDRPVNTDGSVKEWQSFGVSVWSQDQWTNFRGIKLRKDLGSRADCGLSR